MYDENKRLGAEDKKPGGLAVTFVMGQPKKDFDPSKRLGEKPSEDEAPATSGNPDELIDKAVAGICDSLNVSQKAAPGLRDNLEALIHAVVSKPMKETESTEDEEG